MRKLDRYIGTTVFVSILAVLGVILGLAELFAFVDQLGQIDESYTLTEALKFVLLTAPSRGYDMLPMAALIGCLVGLGTLASNSELTIMRAAGVSLQRIVWAVMKPMLVLMFAGILVGEYVIPYTETAAQSGRALAQSGNGSQSSKSGLWHRQGHEFIHINVVRPDGVLLGVTRYDFDENRRLQTASFARQAVFENNQWQLQGVTTTVLHAAEKRSEVVSKPSEAWNIQLSPQLLNTVVMEPEALSITGLWDYIHYLARAGLELQPLLAGVLDQDPAAAGDGRPGIDGDLLHLRSAALGDPRPAGVHRRAGGLHLPYRPGPAWSVQPGVQLPAAAGGAGAGGHLRFPWHIAAEKGGLIHRK